MQTENEVDTVSEFVVGDYKLSMWIPADLVGRVIGKKGIVITNLQRETKTSISALSAIGGSLWLAVIISGNDLKRIYTAYNAISEMVEDEVDDVVFEFTINPKKPFFLYGLKQHSIIKNLSADSNVRIFMPAKDPETHAFISQNSQPAAMSLEGSFENVKRCIEKLDKVAVDYKEAQSKKEKVKRLDDSNQNEGKGRVKPTTSSSKRKEVSIPADDSASNEPTDNGDHNDSELMDASMIASVTIDDGDKEYNIDNIRDKKQQEKNGGETEQNKLGERDNENLEGGTKDEASKITSKKLEKTVDIPSQLVGLLLSKKPPNLKVNIINQIQTLTGTIISKTATDYVSPPIVVQLESRDAVDAALDDHKQDETLAEVVQDAIVAVEEKKTRRRRTVSEDESESENDSDADSDADSDDIDDDGSEGFEDTQTLPMEDDNTNAVVVDGDSKIDPVDEAIHAVVAIDPNDYVRFIVYGYYEENIDMAISNLKEIISGIKIKIVMDKLRISSVKLKKMRGGYKGTKYSENYVPPPRVKGPYKSAREGGPRPPRSGPPREKSIIRKGKPIREKEERKKDGSTPTPYEKKISASYAEKGVTSKRVGKPVFHKRGPPDAMV
eukprot:gene7981-10822_t